MLPMIDWYINKVLKDGFLGFFSGTYKFNEAFNLHATSHVICYELESLRANRLCVSEYGMIFLDQIFEPFVKRKSSFILLYAEPLKVS